MPSDVRSTNTQRSRNLHHPKIRQVCLNFLISIRLNSIQRGHPQNVIQLLSDLLSNQIIRIETINNTDDEGYVEGIQEYLWKRVVQHDPTTGNIKVLFEYVEPQLCRICDPDRNKFWTYTTVIENINAHVKIDKLRDFEKRIAKISSLFTKNISKRFVFPIDERFIHIFLHRIIVYAITNYDIQTNEMLTTHQLNNNKHPVGLNADLLKINSAFSQLYRAQIFECAWLDFEARRNPNIARLIHEKKYSFSPSIIFPSFLVLHLSAAARKTPPNKSKTVECINSKIPP